MARPIESTPRGVLRFADVHGPAHVGRYAPAAPLADVVERYWTVAWDLRGAPAVTRETLPHPSVHILLEAGRSGVAGVSTARFVRTLEGRGRVVGIKFLPGGFHPFRPVPLASFADRVLGLREALGPDAEALETDVLACGDDEAAAVDRAEAFLLARLPEPDPQAQLARRVVARIFADHELTRVEAVAEVAGTSVRALQRLFSEYVGVSPKWVIQRYRLHEALARLDGGESVDLTRLALDLGYCDQAHFINDFKSLVGRTPAVYARHGS